MNDFKIKLFKPLILAISFVGFIIIKSNQKKKKKKTSV